MKTKTTPNLLLPTIFALLCSCEAVRMARPEELADPKLEVPVVKKPVATGTELVFAPFRIFGVVDKGVDSKGATVSVGGWGGGKTERNHDYSFSIEDRTVGGKIWQVRCHSEYKASSTFIGGINAGAKGEQTTSCDVKGPTAWTVKIAQPVGGNPAGELSGENVALTLEPITKTSKGHETRGALGYGIRNQGTFVAAAELVQGGFWWEVPGNQAQIHTAAGLLLGVVYYYKTISG